MFNIAYSAPETWHIYLGPYLPISVLYIGSVYIFMISHWEKGI